MYLYWHSLPAGRPVTITPMATIISTANQKGGPGKTMTAINVVSALVDSGYRVSVIDADEQATFHKWNVVRRKEGLPAYDVTSVPVGMLEEELEHRRADKDVDVVLVDCPGNIQNVTQTAVMSSDAILCPVRATWTDFEATKALAKFVGMVQSVHPETRFMLFINAKHVSRSIDKGAKENLIRIFAKHANTRVLNTEIPDAAVIAEFGGRGKNVFEYAPKSPVSKLYKKLTKEVVECLQAVSASV